MASHGPRMDCLRSQIDHCRTGICPLKLVICLFSLNASSGRCQHLIVAIGNGSQDRRERVGVSHSSPPLVRHCDSVAAFSFAPDKRPENIFDPEEVISDQQRSCTHKEDAFRPSGAMNSISRGGD